MLYHEMPGSNDVLAAVYVQQRKLCPYLPPSYS